MQAQIQIQNTGTRIVTARARFGKDPKDVVPLRMPPSASTQTVSFDMTDAQDAAKFKALAALLTDTKGPLKHHIVGKKSALTVTVSEPKVEAPEAKQGASKAGR